MVKLLYMLSCTVGAIIGGMIVNNFQYVLPFCMGSWLVYLLDTFLWSKQ